ncbi:amidohydrolase family protein [Nocardioidaceae bacterium SCSIO 66511]|nr:amidohydrolase family protein [Nocardioidaceae bacterium SCSIO 66511]
MSTETYVTAEHAFVNGHVEPNVAVGMSGGRITEIVPRHAARSGVPLQDWGAALIVPGLVNAHGHSFQTVLRGIVDDLQRGTWRTSVLYPWSESLCREDIYAVARFAFAEALLSGTTTTNDFFYLHDDGNENAHAVIRAAQDVGIRLVFARTVYERGRVPGAPDRYFERVGDSIERFRSLVVETEDIPTVSVQLAAHSLRGVSLDALRATYAGAREAGSPMHVHVHDAPAERSRLHNEFGKTPIRVLRDEGMLGPDTILVHCLNLEDDEIRLIAEAHGNVVHCPSTSMFFGHRTAPIEELRTRGALVALGFDGGSGNNHQSIFTEMRIASLLQKQLLANPAALPAEAAWELGTSHGARMQHVRAGAIEVGAHADLVGLDLTNPSLQPVSRVPKHLVHSMEPTAIKNVIVGGRTIIESGRLQTVDLEDIVAGLNQVHERLESTHA